MRYRISIIGLCLGFVLSLSAPSFAAEPEEPSSQQGLAVQGMVRIIEALEGLMDSIPQYELPRLDENGDIIIRRKRQPSQRPIAPEPEFDETST